MREYFKIINKKLSTKDKTSLILIQGATCSGKSSFTLFLHKSIKRLIDCEIIHLDDYYKPFDSLKTEEELLDYDFDNPGAFDWELLESTLKAYAYKNKKVPIVKRDIKTKTAIKKTVDNTFPKFIILEGIYAFNLFNSYKYNLDHLDPFKEPNKHSIELILRKNESNLFNFFNLLKITLKVDQFHVRRIRLKRDIEYEFSKEVTSYKLEKFVLPGLSLWVDPKINQSDIEIEGGAFNKEECETFAETLCSYFKNKNSFLLKGGQSIKRCKAIE